MRRDNDSLILYKLIVWLNEQAKLYEELGDAEENYLDAGHLYSRASQINKVLAKIQKLEAGL